MKLFVGLGNKGEKYNYTRHNIGFMIIDDYLKNNDIISVKKKNNYHIYELYVNNKKIFFMKPRTYMNNSGIAVRDFSRYNNIKENEIFVITDDINLEFGKIRIRKFGSAGGHNGLKSIISCLGGNDFPRLRIGIGLPQETENEHISNYVLNKFNKNEINNFDNLFNITTKIINEIIYDMDLSSIMNRYNNIKITD
jgi:peptidyl-tRNA hydrolase, PTH1 family